MSPSDIRYVCTSILLLTRGLSLLPHVRYGVLLITAAQFNPIFITGFPRSGTTMVAAILDRHSAVAIPPETNFFEAMKSLRDIPPGSSTPQVLERLLGAYGMNNLSLQASDVAPLLNGTDRTSSHVFQAVLTAYQHGRGKPMIGEKTPRHIMHSDQLLTWYPQSKMIFVVRDGRDAVASLLNMPWRGHGIARLHASTWNRYMAVAYRTHRRFPGRCLFIKYEDILIDPETQVRRLDQFCGVPFEPQQIDASIPTHVVPKTLPPWMLLATRPIEPNHVGHWRKAFSRQDQWVINYTMRPYLKLFGYQDDNMCDCPVRRRIWIGATGLLLRTGETRRVYRAFFG